MKDFQFIHLKDFQFIHLTEEFLKIITLSKNRENALNSILEKKREVEAAMRAEGYKLNAFNDRTKSVQRFRKDLQFIEEGIRGSWKDNITSEEAHNYYELLQHTVQSFLIKMKK